MTIYCTYLTVYFGSKLPPFYIGSTQVSRIESGYRGTVSSKKYKEIWKSELKQNPHLFKTKILTTHASRKDAICRELDFHKKLSVVRSPMYINMSYASPNGFFGMDQQGIDKPQSMRDKLVGNKNASGNHKSKTDKHKNKISKALIGRTVSEESRKRQSESMRGRKQSPEHIEKKRLAAIGKKRGPYKKKL